ncbi:alpha/beta hydrolase family protein [Mycolicibacterium moriokaense]|uniref:Alpha/beta hydrolase family protein n=1 Tax=Mycolicibacterium moriokaense TaxID=39691 RepID=A0A318HIR5_9MYCO|nr:alpha/beta hydrolase family protein [Mycolicibacterium moriokaense]
MASAEVTGTCADPERTGLISVFAVTDSNTHTQALPPLEVPARTLPVPETVSPELQRVIGAPLSGNWNTWPQTDEGWKKLSAPSAGRGLPALREHFNVESEPMTINGVQAYLVTPQDLPTENRDRLLVHIHGGCYVLSGGEAGTAEAIYMAGFGRFKVLSVDYRRPPEFMYPAALDDAVAVWKGALEMADPKNMAIFGTSAGGALTLSTVLRAKQEKLALPAAIAPGTPMSDLTRTGDSFQSNHMVDNVLVAADGACDAMARLYAGGHDLGSDALARLRRHDRLPAHGPYDGDARSTAEQHSSRPPQAASGGSHRGPARLRGAVARALHARRERPRNEGGVRGDRDVLRQAPGEIGLYRVHRCRPADEATGCGADGLPFATRSEASITAVIGTASASKPITKTGNRNEKTSGPPGTAAV